MPFSTVPISTLSSTPKLSDHQVRLIARSLPRRGPPWEQIDVIDVSDQPHRATIAPPTWRLYHTECRLHLWRGASYVWIMHSGRHSARLN